MKRRRFLHASIGAGAGVLVAIACGPAFTSAPDKPGASPSPSGSLLPRRGSSRGELRVLEPFLPLTLDTDVGISHTILQSLGVCESLMRYRPDLTVEPWVASRLEQVDPLTWRVTLRDDVTFWDGQAVDAAAVKASFERTLEKQSTAADLLPKGTTLAANGRTLTLKTTTPIGVMPMNLAAPTLAIRKSAGDGAIFTGAFRPTQFTAKESLVLEAYPGYRGGPANLKSIRARQVADSNARALALQAGDADIAQALLPSDVAKLRAAGADVYAAPWARQHMLLLNVRSAPLSDPALRRAVSAAIDRQALVTAVLEGIGTPAYGIAPPDIGLPGIASVQRHDPAESRRLLDAAGWRIGTGPFREKDGKRLSFKLGTYPGRTELDQFAVLIVDQLKAVGIEASIERFQDVEAQLAKNEFQATMYSLGSAVFGDVSRLLATLYTPSPRNRDRYENPEVTRLYNDYITTADPKAHADQLGRIQELLAQDVPIVHLANPYQVVASKKVRNFSPHPLDSYKYDADVMLAD